MENKKDSYNEVGIKLQETDKELQALEQNSLVKKYIELNNTKKELLSQQKQLYKDLRLEQFSSCKHILVATFYENDSFEGRTYNYYGCIKCGLDQKIFSLLERYDRLDDLPFEQKIMYEYLYENPELNGLYNGVSCNLSLARAIYLRLKSIYPDIDDETARKYFEIALDNIRNIKVSKERQKSRAKRLSLNPNFNKWDIY